MNKGSCLQILRSQAIVRDVLIAIKYIALVLVLTFLTVDFVATIMI